MPGSPVPAPADVRAAEAARPARRLSRWWTLWWVRVLAVFVASRVVTTSILLVFAANQGPNPWTGAHPDYFSYSTIWDGLWYNIVAVSGYPSALPMEGAHVGQNAWAFLPGYPAAANAVILLTHLPWAPAADLVSILCAGAAALVFYRLMLRIGLGESTSLFAVVLFCVAPVTPLFQLAYAESMYLLLLVTALLLLVERHYVWLFPVVLVMAFTRPSGLAFALALGMHVVYRWVKRRDDPFPPGERVLSVALTVFSFLAGIAWPVIAAVATGSPNAYMDTELSWRAPYVGYAHLVPFSPWFQSANWWATVIIGVPGWLGVIVVLLLVVGFCVMLFTPAVRRIGVDLRFWVAAYGVYLFAVFFPQSSTFRLLMPLFPLLGAIALPKSRIYRVGIVATFLLLQVGWIALCWGVVAHDWSPP